MTILTKEQFLAHLDDIRNQVATNNSFEGTFTWTAYNDKLQPNQFMLGGVYRCNESIGSNNVRSLSEYHSGSVISSLSNSATNYFEKNDALVLIDKQVSEYQKKIEDLQLLRYEVSKKR
jgi:hypothetical protein